MLGGFVADFVLLEGIIAGSFSLLGGTSKSNSRCHSNSNRALRVLEVVLVHVIRIVIHSRSDSNTESTESSQSLLNLKEADISFI